MIKAVIFDLDGVIADSEPLSGKSTDMVLERHGIKLTPAEKLEAFGRRSPDIFRDALSKRNINADVDGMVRLKDRLLLGMIKKSLKSVPGSLEAVKRLKEGGLRVALATSSHEEKMRMELRELGITGLFGVTVNGSEVERGKPDPEMFLKAAEKLGVKPRECAVIEDSTFGVQAAKAAGMLAVGFRSPNSPGQDLSSADIVVDDLREVASHLPT
jgi:HAD superfamily hydrolase (TIGR01509 family)